MKVIFERDYKPIRKLVNGSTEFRNIHFNDETLFVKCAKYVFNNGKVGFIDDSNESVINMPNGIKVQF